jgi:hypothetical protein
VAPKQPVIVSRLRASSTLWYDRTARRAMVVLAESIPTVVLDHICSHSRVRYCRKRVTTLQQCYFLLIFKDNLEGLRPIASAVHFRLCEIVDIALEISLCLNCYLAGLALLLFCLSRWPPQTHLPQTILHHSARCCCGRPHCNYNSESEASSQP